MYVCLSFCPVYAFVCACQSVSLFVCLSVCANVRACLPVCLSVCLSVVCLSVCPDFPIQYYKSEVRSKN